MSPTAWGRLGPRRNRSRGECRLPAGTTSSAVSRSRCSAVGNTPHLRYSRTLARSRTRATSLASTETPGSGTWRSASQAVARSNRTVGCSALKPGACVQPAHQREPDTGISEVRIPKAPPNLGGMLPSRVRSSAILGQTCNVMKAELGRDIRDNVRRNRGWLCQERAQESNGGQLEREPQLVVGTATDSDQIKVGVVEMEVGSKLLIRWRTNKVAVRSLLSGRQEFGWHPCRSLRRRRSATSNAGGTPLQLNPKVLDQNASREFLFHYYSEAKFAAGVGRTSPDGPAALRWTRQWQRRTPSRCRRNTTIVPPAGPKPTFGTVSPFRRMCQVFFGCVTPRTGKEEAAWPSIAGDLRGGRDEAAAASAGRSLSATPPRC
jgi:hypothetical protein